MRGTRFSCSERLLCNIAGVPFEQMTPVQRNNIRILNMYFSTPETYHNNVTQELANFVEDVNLQVSDLQTDPNTGISYYAVTAAGQPAPTVTTTSVDEMAEKISERLKLPVNIINKWDDDSIQTAYNNLNLAPRQKTTQNMSGYLLIDPNEHYVRFKASTSSADDVVKVYDEYVKQQESLVAEPAS